MVEGQQGEDQEESSARDGPIDIASEEGGLQFFDNKQFFNNTHFRH